MCAVLDATDGLCSLSTDDCNRLLVRLPGQGQDGPRRFERVTFLPARSPCPPDEVARFRKMTVLRFGLGFIPRVSGIQEADLRGGSGASYKISALAESVSCAERGAVGPPIVRYVLWTALARSVAMSFGNYRQRSNDGWLNPAALERIVLLVEDRLSGTLPVNHLADAAGLSASAFLRAFRGSIGITPGEYILERRIALGAELLTTTDLPVSVVAVRAGFKSGNHFATTFGARRGVSPSAHRRRAAVTT